MNVIFNELNSYILRFDKNENVFEQLTEFCKSRTIKAATFQGIGAAKEVVLSYYDLPSKKYKEKTFNENVEIVSLTGNLANFENQLIVHAHGVFAKRDLATIGGHINKIIISATCEIELKVLNSILLREFNDEIGLKLLK